MGFSLNFDLYDCVEDGYLSQDDILASHEISLLTCETHVESIHTVEFIKLTHKIIFRKHILVGEHRPGPLDLKDLGRVLWMLKSGSGQILGLFRILG